MAQPIPLVRGLEDVLLESSIIEAKRISMLWDDVRSR